MNIATALSTPAIDAANKKAFDILVSGEPVLMELRQAREICAPLDSMMLLHSGPPIEWSQMCGPMKGAVGSAIVFEGWAKTQDEAYTLADKGIVAFDCTHHHGFVGPVSGIVSPSMWVYCVRNVVHGNWAFCTVNEGMGRALRFGAYGDDVQLKLRWVKEILGPVLCKVLKRLGEISLRQIMVQALEMGDECHNRHQAARLLVFAELLPGLLAEHSAGLLPSAELDQIVRFISTHYYFFVDLSMAACKAICDPISNLSNSTLVYAMARNGVDFGIRVAGLGDEWFTAPCNSIDGIFFHGYTTIDGNPDLGDSSITETAGLGAFAMAAAPAICKYIGGSPSENLASMMRMYGITAGEHPVFQIPSLGYRGTPSGIDIRKVVATGILPIINSSISHIEAGIGQIGAGQTLAPFDCFSKAIEAFRVNDVGCDYEKQVTPLYSAMIKTA